MGRYKASKYCKIGMIKVGVQDLSILKIKVNLDI
jgi:hypothetical protein